MSILLPGSTLTNVLPAWKIQRDDVRATQLDGTEKDDTSSCGDWLKIAARILLNSCQGIYTFD